VRQVHCHSHRAPRVSRQGHGPHTTIDLLIAEHCRRAVGSRQAKSFRVEDTIGNHDTICGCCSAEINYLRYKVKDTPSCRANFLRELAKYGLDSRSLVPNINLFMNIPIDANGELQIRAPLSRPGDHVDLAADMECLAMISNCPQILNPANNFNPTPVRMVTFAAAR